MQTHKKEVLTEIIEMWREKNISSCSFKFSCGGDSMNETEIYLYDKENNVILCDDLTDYFGNEVYDAVEFYVNSDGHYIGESGEVEITLNDSDDSFDYYKSSKSEYEETVGDRFEFQLTDEECKLIEDKISSLLFSVWDGQHIVYREDCIITDKEEEMIKSLIDRITDESESFDFYGDNGEEQEESTTWETEDPIKVSYPDTKMTINVEKRFYQFKED